MPPKYQKLDHIDHILKRPDTYIGSVKPRKELNEWVADLESATPKIIKKDEITYAPGLLRIFVEILSNAIDNVWRSKQEGIPCSRIDITINRETGETTIKNDGLSIPVEKNEDTGIYNPELIFGHLLTSSNYNDDEERLTSGRNGYGAKLTNVFSKKFSVKTFDTNNNKVYYKEWSNNMRDNKPEKITSSKLKKGFTEISWIPDFARFGTDSYDDTIISVYYRYIYDCAMLTEVSVFLNDQKIPIKNLSDYSKCYMEENSRQIVTMESENCQVVITPNNHQTDFEHISFANGVFNKEGGIHVEMWSEEIFRPIVEKFNKPNKPQINIKDVKKFFRLFVVATVPNPEFSSQSKTYLTSPKVKVEVNEKTINTILKWDTCNGIKDIIKGKELLTLKKTEKKTKSFKKVEGYDRANYAGTKHSKDCTLILTEGLSAKTYSVAGIEVGFGGKSGRNWFGIYPLRGKLLNCRNAKVDSISKNKEITDLIQILGLKYGVDYTEDKNFSNLNYGKVMILTDADVDGIHIKGLIQNFFHAMFPSLYKRDESFIISMETPIVKVFDGKKEIPFYREENYHKYVEQVGEGKKLKVKYYKGLGTSNDDEIQNTFGKKVVEYIYDENTDKNMDKVFHVKNSNDRKDWLENYDPKSLEIIDDENIVSQMNISDFINKELIKFSIDDCKRSIPNIFDGLKQSQRKILYATFLKNPKESIKVAQLAGFVAEKTNYHHGEMCLFDTITKMAQDFVGSNNIPYLEKDGQFGTRILLGKDAANGRYIFTKLEKLTRLLFPEEDDVLLTSVIDDGDKVEPEYYIPILPMILINGCSAGIGTGWSCQVPQFNPIDVIKCVKIWLKKKTIYDKGEQEGEVYSLLPELLPWYRGYKGTIEKVSTNKYNSIGIMSKDGDKINITELPVQVATEKYKEFLEDLLEEKKIKTLENYCTPNTINFVFKENDKELDLESLKLKGSISATNMVLFIEDGRLKKFEHIDDIVEYFCQKRFKYYELRKEYKLAQLKEDLKYLKNKSRFLEEVMNDKLVIYKRDTNEVVKDMTINKYNKKDDSYNYLLNLSVSSFTTDKLNTLNKDISKVEDDINTLQNTTCKQLWLNDLEKFEQKYLEWLDELEQKEQAKLKKTVKTIDKKKRK